MVNAYSGTLTKTGNSQAIRFEKGFFQALGLSSQVRFSATIISPGQILLSVVDQNPGSETADPVMESFLSFIEQEFKTNPQQTLSPLTAEMLESHQRLAAIIPAVSDAEEFSDDDFDC